MKCVILDTFWTALDNAVSNRLIFFKNCKLIYSVYYIGLAWWVWFLIAILIAIVALALIIVGLFKCIKHVKGYHRKVKPIDKA